MACEVGRETHPTTREITEWVVKLESGTDSEHVQYLNVFNKF